MDNNFTYDEFDGDPDHFHDHSENFKLKVDINYVSDPNATIRYDSFFGGIYKGSFSSVKLSWTPQTDRYLLGYNIYFSVYPLIKNKANKEKLVTDTHYEMELPLFPQNIYFYFWISKVVGNLPDIPVTETLLNREGWTTYKSSLEETIYGPNPIEPNFNFPETDNINESIKDTRERIRIDRIMGTQIRGVECDIYFRRWGTQKPYGIPCTCTEDKQDPDFMGSTRCPLCFGTGIIGGYYPPIRMLVNFQAHPAQNFKGYVRGMTVEQTYEAWTTVPPFFREQDLVVRLIDGRRWTIKEVNNTFLRGSANSQAFSLDLIPPTDIKQIVSLETINSALKTLDNPDFNTPGRNNSF